MDLLKDLKNYLCQISDMIYDTHVIKDTFLPKVIDDELHITSSTNDNLVIVDYLGGHSYVVQLNDREAFIRDFDEIEQMYGVVVNQLFFPITYVLRDIQDKLNAIKGPLQFKNMPELFMINAIHGSLYVKIIKTGARFKLLNHASYPEIEIQNVKTGESTIIDYDIHNSDDLILLRDQMDLLGEVKLSPISTNS